MSTRKLPNAPAGGGGFLLTLKVAPYQREVKGRERAKGGKPEFVISMNRSAYRKIQRQAVRDGQESLGRWLIDRALNGNAPKKEVAR